MRGAPKILRPGADWLLTRPFAHRGLHDGARPENSLGACEAALAAGYPIELDVHLGVDDELVVFHDDTLSRMTGVAGRVDQTPWSRLSTLRLAGTDEPIPRLADVLAQVRGQVPLVVELKAGRDNRRLPHAVLDALAGYRGDVALQSFHPLVLAAIRRRAPDAIVGVLSCDFVDSDLSAPERFALRRLLLAPLARPDYVGYALGCLPYWAPTLARRLGCPLIAWTIRTPADLDRALRLADNYIFEGVRPDPHR